MPATWKRAPRPFKGVKLRNAAAAFSTSPSASATAASAPTAFCAMCKPAAPTEAQNPGDARLGGARRQPVDIGRVGRNESRAAALDAFENLRFGVGDGL